MLTLKKNQEELNTKTSLCEASPFACFNTTPDTLNYFSSTCLLVYFFPFPRNILNLFPFALVAVAILRRILS